MPLPLFIRKCWGDNRGWGRQFVLGLKKGYIRRKDGEKIETLVRSFREASRKLE